MQSFPVGQAPWEQKGQTFAVGAAPWEVPQEEPNRYGALFRASSNDSPLVAGAKAIGNLPSSTWNLAKGIGTAILNPIDTAKGVANVMIGGGAKVQNALSSGVDKVFGTEGFGKNNNVEAQQAFTALVDLFKERYGSLENAQKTATEDPVGFGSDVLSVIYGGAALTGKTAQLGNMISKTAQVVTRPVSTVARTVTSKTGQAARFGASQATGLSPETISTITSETDAFRAARATGATRADLAENIYGAVQKAQQELSDLGQGYGSIREARSFVTLPDSWVETTLSKYGLKLKNGKVTADTFSKTRNVTDINKIQEFIDNWGNAKTFTSEEYLNMRHDLAELAKYDITGNKSKVAQDFARDVREGILNSDDVRGQIDGLKNLDAQYAEDIKFYQELERDLINKQTGQLKDGAASKIVNAVNAANPERLARLEKLYPGFTKQAKVIKAVEDVENAMGLKVGAYARAGIGVGGALTGNMPMIVGAILATPEIAVPLLQAYGYTAKNVGPILEAIRQAASDINNFRIPGAIEQYMQEKYPEGVPAGLSIRKTVTPASVAKKMREDDYQKLASVIDDPEQAKLDPGINRMLDDMGLGRATNDELVRFAKDAIDEYDGLGEREILQTKDGASKPLASASE